MKRVRTHDAAATAALFEATGQGLGYIERFLETPKTRVAPRRGVRALQPAAAAIASSSVKSPS